MGQNPSTEAEPAPVEVVSTESAFKNASTFMVVFQLAIVLLMAFWAKVGDLNAMHPGTVTQGYNMFIGVEIMMFIGFGYLMTFLRKYGISAVGFTMVVVAMGLQWSLFTESFFKQWYNTPEDEKWDYVWINIYTLLQALYAISAVLISFGACIGKLTPTALIIMTVMELLCHSVNYVVLMGKEVLQIADIGGTYIDHMFGAYFGLAVAYQLGKPASNESASEGGPVADVFSLLGTAFLWVYWPSFVAGADAADSVSQHRAIVHTILALAASTTSVFALSMYMSPNKKFQPVDIQNATLAGGVAIGVVANLTLTPLACIIIGSVAGCVSTWGYNTLQPILEEYGIHDTCGVHNLHGLPAVVGALASVIIAASKDDFGDEDADIYGTDQSKHWWIQFLAIFVCIAFAIAGGSFTGFVINFFGFAEKGAKFEDSTWWDTASSEKAGAGIMGAVAGLNKL